MPLISPLPFLPLLISCSRVNLCWCVHNMVRLFSSLLGVSCLFRASIAQSPSNDNAESTSSVCAPTTGLYAIYTSDSSTYLIQDGARTGQAVASCPAEATSTVLEVSTVWQTNDISTVYRSSTYYVSNLSTIACGPSSISNGSINCPPPATVTIPASSSALSFGGITQTSISTVLQEVPCPLNATIPITITSLLSNNQSCPNCPSQSGTDLYSWLLANQSVTCSTIANISAVVTSSVSGSLVSETIYGSANCPIIFDSSPRTGFAPSVLTAESEFLDSISTVSESASCQTVSTLPPVTTSIYLPNTSCENSTVFSTIFQNASTKIISSILPVTTSIYLSNPSCENSTVFSTILQNASTKTISSTLPFTTSIYLPNSNCPAPTVISTIFESGSTGSLPGFNSSCPTCPSTALANASTITLSQSFISTIYTQDPSCIPVNVSSMYLNSLISATRYTTVYGPDVTVTRPGSSFTTMGSDAYCETCPDACYVDFNDDGIPDAEQNGTFPTNGTIGYNSTNSTPVPAPDVIADTNFENGTGDPLTSSASSPNVTAVIAQSNDGTPLMAQSGQSYL